MTRLPQPIWMCGRGSSHGSSMVIRIDGYDTEQLYCASFMGTGKFTHLFTIDHAEAQRSYLNPQQQSEFCDPPAWANSAIKNPKRINRLES